MVHMMEIKRTCHQIFWPLREGLGWWSPKEWLWKRVSTMKKHRIVSNPHALTQSTADPSLGTLLLRLGWVLAMPFLFTVWRRYNISIHEAFVSCIPSVHIVLHAVNGIEHTRIVYIVDHAPCDNSHLIVSSVIDRNTVGFLFCGQLLHVDISVGKGEWPPRRINNKLLWTQMKSATL